MCIRDSSIRVDDLRGAAIAALLREHLANAARHSPPGSCHTLDLEGLRAPEVTFWSAWDGEDLLGFGALKALGPEDGEVKSMHTAAAHRGRGVAAAILETLLAEARARGYRRVWLETGSMEAYAPARRLYERYGFETCEPFADYVLDPYSMYMRLELSH